MRVNLDNKIALVTGAGQNIGKAIADRLAENGAIVVFSDIQSENAKEAAAKWPGCAARTLDVSSESAVDETVRDIVRTYGRLDIVVNNAGVNTRKRVPIDEFPTEEWQRIVDIDLTGLYYVSRAAARVMKPMKSGRIINIASVVGLTALRLQCAFAAAKAGVIHFSKAIAVELGNHGIQVNAIAPGSISTEGTRGLFYGDNGEPTEQGRELLAHIPLGRAGTVDDIAQAALFLAAPESSYITGTVLTVDGGWTAGYARNF